MKKKTKEIIETTTLAVGVILLSAAAFYSSKETGKTAVFKGGIIFNSNTIKTGSASIDTEISYIYNVNPKQAEKIKETFAIAHKEFASKTDVYEINNKLGIKTKINQYEISDVVNYYWI